MVNSNQGWMLCGEIHCCSRSWNTVGPHSKMRRRSAISGRKLRTPGTYESVNGRIRVAQDSNRLLVEFAFQNRRFSSVSCGRRRILSARAINLRLRFAGTDPARPSELTVVNGNKADLFKPHRLKLPYAIHANRLVLLMLAARGAALAQGRARH